MAEASPLPAFLPRTYQYGFLGSFARGERRKYCVIWPRRHGKDRSFINAATQVALRKPCNVFHCFPKYAQARTSIWEGIDAVTGRPILDDIAPYVVKRREDTMTLELENGSIYRFIGSDNYATIVGAGPYIIGYSEWARCDPQARAYFLPMILENKGFEVFLFTAFGNNHGKAMADVAAANPNEWFYDYLTIEDTYKDGPGENGEPVITQADLDSLRNEWETSLGKSGMSPEMINQEFYNNWAGVMEGNYYGQQMDKAEREGRVTDLPIISGTPIDTYWDLGRRDATSIWFVQAVGDWFNVVDYFEASGQDVEYYAHALQQKGYVYRSHVWPHDGTQTHFAGPGETRQEAGERLLKPPVEIMPVGRIQDGINAVRAVLARCKFDRNRCARGIDAMRSYHKEWDDVRKVFRDVPNHDWASNPADAFRTFAMRARGIEVADQPGQSGGNLPGGSNSWMGR